MSGKIDTRIYTKYSIIKNIPLIYFSLYKNVFEILVIVIHGICLRNNMFVGQ